MDKELHLYTKPQHKAYQQLHNTRERILFSFWKIWENKYLKMIYYKTEDVLGKIYLMVLQKIEKNIT